MILSLFNGVRKRNQNSRPPALRITRALLHEKSYPRVGFSLRFSPRMGSPHPSFPVAFGCFFGSRKGELLIVGRVRFLVKPPFFGGWQPARVTGRTTSASDLLTSLFASL